MGMIRLGLGLLLLMASNILLGLVNATIAFRFSKEILSRGLLKASIIVICFALACTAGYLNPDIASIQVNGMEVNVLSAVNMVVLAGYYHYTRQVISKFAALVSGKVDVQQPHDGSDIT